MKDITRSSDLSPEVERVIDAMFDTHEMSADQARRGESVRRSCADTMKVIVKHVPAGPDRSAALRKLREVRFDCDQALLREDNKF